MNNLCIIATFVAIILGITGYENQTVGPIWLAILIMAFVVMTRLFMVFEANLSTKNDNR